MNDYFSFQFLIYLGRWILSAIVMFFPLWILVKFKCCEGKYQEYIHLVLVQIIGAIIFYHLDKIIFS
jgi:hypothetical protein